MKTIDKFINEEFFLSNFYESPLTYKGKEYKTVEHGFQAQKSEIESEQEWIRNMDTPGKAKRGGLKVHLRKDWETVKEDIMLDLIRIKFSDPELSKKLTDLVGYELIEGNFWHDNFYGDCICQKCKDIEGQNKLGKILMKVRDEIINKS